MELLLLLNGQVTHELKNSIVYNVLGVKCDTLGLFKARDFFYKQSKDETEHSKMIINYLCDRGMEFLGYNTIESIKCDCKNFFECLTTAYKLECLTTQMLNNIKETALEHRDYLTEVFINDMLKEQIEEEKIFNDILATAEGMSNAKYELLQLENILLSLV